MFPVFTAGIVLIAKPDEYNFKSFLYKTGSNRVYFGLPLGGNIDVDGEWGSQAIWCGFKIDFVDDKIIFPGIEVYDRRIRS